MRRPSILLGGLRLLVRHPGAVVWTYVFNLALALIFSLALHAQLASVLNHSMAAQGLNAAFDLGTLGAAMHQLGYRTPPSGGAAYASLPLYFLVYFVLVPGALSVYRNGLSGRLSRLLGTGLQFFWRFVRITLLTLMVSGLILGPIVALESRWAEHLDEHVVGVQALYEQLPGWAAILLVASLLRLYFDLVEVYTVQLDARVRPNGKSDRRVRKTLLPALKTLWRNLPRALGTFLLLAVLGVLAVAATAAAGVDMLPRPWVWPVFLIFQVGLFASLIMRYWQRAAETELATQYPLPGDGVETLAVSESILLIREHKLPVEESPVVIGSAADPLDAQPNPEPAAP
jgi:hypothetical protein